jgi:predicted transcriptional regulator
MRAIVAEITPMTVRFPAEVYQELRRLAYERHASMTGMAVTAVREWLDRQQNGEQAR